MKQLVKSKWKIFMVAMLQVMFVAANVTFIAHGQIIAMLVTGFMISLLWTYNVKSISLGGMTDKLVYSTGAMCGTGIGYFLSHVINQHL